MKASKFTEVQIAFVLKHADEVTGVAEVCRKPGIPEAIFYVWRKKYGNLLPTEMKRLRQLEDENAKLKRIVAELSLDKAMLQDVLKKKLQGLLANCSLLINCGPIGKCQLDGLVPLFNLFGRFIFTSPDEAIRPTLKLESGISVRRRSGTAIDEPTFSSNVKGGK
jgi:putative transposase